MYISYFQLFAWLICSRYIVTSTIKFNQIRENEHNDIKHVLKIINTRNYLFEVSLSRLPLQ